MRMSNDKGYFMREIEMLHVAMSRVRKLSDDHMVDNEEDTIAGL